MWTERQAASITTIRGTAMRGVRCDGTGRRRIVRATTVYRHFACVGRTGLAYQGIDTVRVTYVLHPLDQHRGRQSRFIATNVRYEGFGVP